MNDLLKEFELDMKRERQNEIWQRFGRMMVMLSVGLVALTVVYVVWKDYARSSDMKETSQLVAATEKLNAGNYKEAIEQFDKLAETGSSSHAPLALLRKAEAEKASGDSQAAAKTYEELAKHNHVFAGLAKLHAEETTLPPRDAAFYFARSEQYAWGLLKEGKKDEAVQIMQSLRDDEMTPRSQRRRLAQLLAHLSPEDTMKDEKDER
jgi:hypothetical protein